MLYMSAAVTRQYILTNSLFVHLKPGEFPSPLELSPERRRVHVHVFVSMLRNYQLIHYSNTCWKM